MTIDIEQREAKAREGAWRCRRCGSIKWVSASLNQGLTRIAQCIPCGYYSSDNADKLIPWRELDKDGAS